MNKMHETIDQLRKIVADYSGRLASVREDDYQLKPGPKKWSKKEILSHLVDSAQNNIRRFVVGQYEEEPHIVYQQDSWVSISGYQDYPIQDLISLWTLLNNHIVRILQNTTDEGARRYCLTDDPEPHSIAWLARDYNAHLVHHLHQVLDLEPAPYR